LYGNTPDQGNQRSRSPARSRLPAAAQPHADPRNARTHPKRQIAQIIASIREFGFTNPILADPEGKLIAGHGRLRAAWEMGLSEVPVIELAGLSDPQKRALRRRQQDRAECRVG
jgi:ParB-like chromosome segregation protein Spo0J